MFCRKCGTKNADNAKFCAACGAPMTPVNPGANPGANPAGGMGQGVPMQKKTGNHAGIIVIAAVVIVALLASFLFFGVGIGGRSYKKTIDQMVEAMNDGDLGEFVDLIPEDAIVYAMKQEGYEGSKKELLKEAEDLLGEDWEDALGSVAGAVVDVDYEIKDKEDIKGDDLDYIKEQYKEADVKVSAAMKVNVKFTVKAFGLNNDTTQEVPLIKVGRSWYLDLASMGGL